MDTLKIKNLKAQVENKEILKGVNLEIKSGEIHVIMGKNGSGKSTLLNALMGKPSIKITEGEVFLNDVNILPLSTSKRANLGLFLGFQHPTEIPGVSFRQFLREALNTNIKENSEKIGPLEFVEIAQEKSKTLKLDDYFILRNVNEGFSGGEKKKAEILQMAILKPKFALLDEIDSGLDVDSLKEVAETIQKIKKEENTGIILITHYNHILKYLKPDFVHIFNEGKITKSGDHNLAKKIEKEGFEDYIK